MLADKLRAASLTALPLPEFVSSSVNTVSANTNTVTAPTGIQDGDLLVAVGFFDGQSRFVSTVPSGFDLAEYPTAATLVFMAKKVAVSESGNYTFTFSASGANTVAILVYRSATTVNTIGATSTATSATATASEITPTYAGTICAVFATESTATITTPPSGMTQRAAATGTSIGVAVYDLKVQSAAATGAKSLVWSGSSTVAAFLLQITNEPDVAPEFVASASTQDTLSGSTLVINKPTGTVEGDLMVAVMARSGTNSTWTGDTDWTEVADKGSPPDLRVAYKVAGASEGASYTFTNTDNGRISSGSILTYRYAAYDTIGTFAGSTDPLILPSISPSESQSILIAAGARISDSVTLGTPTGMTARVTDNDATSPSYIVCDQTVAKGLTGTRSMSVASTTATGGIMLSIKPTRSL